MSDLNLPNLDDIYDPILQDHLFVDTLPSSPELFQEQVMEQNEQVNAQNSQGEQVLPVAPAVEQAFEIPKDRYLWQLDPNDPRYTPQQQKRIRKCISDRNNRERKKMRINDAITLEQQLASKDEEIAALKAEVRRLKEVESKNQILKQELGQTKTELEIERRKMKLAMAHQTAEKDKNSLNFQGSQIEKKELGDQVGQVP